MSGRGSGVLAMEEGGRPSAASSGVDERAVERDREQGEGLGSFARMRRNSARNSRGQRRDESRLHLRRRSQSFSAAAAARLGKDLRQGLGWGSSARSRALFKGVMACGASQNGRSTRPDRSPSGVRCGHEVGERPDQWAPPGSDSGARDLLDSGRREV
jgi:hypothetical protein